MIVFDRVTYRYAKTVEAVHQTPPPILSEVSLHIAEGELALVVGPSGAGKSTFLRCINGLVPHFYGGVLSGHIAVAGQNPVALGPQGMSRYVGMVFQDPETQFVTNRVEDELVFGMENQALPRPLMRKRVEEVLDQLAIAHLRRRPLNTLSGGEKQRVAIAAVLTMHPDVLVLDEPTSQLDPQSAEEVLVAIRRLNEDLGLTVILAEHRLERVVQFVDRVVYFPGQGGAPLIGAPQEIMAHMTLTPPLVSLGKAMRWQPLPLTVKQARRFLRSGAPSLASTRSAAAELSMLTADRSSSGAPALSPVLRCQGVTYRYPGGGEALRGVTLTLHRGEVAALMGRNGSGKSTLLKHMAGLLKPQQGAVEIYRPDRPAPASWQDTRSAAAEEIVQIIGYVPQNPGALLFRDTVLEELTFTRQGHQLPADPAADHSLLARLGLVHLADRYPRDLSSGERQRVALAAILVADPSIVLLDEPTRGLDYEQKEALTAILLGLRHRGCAVVLATHDVELAARCADRVILMGEGEIIIDGPTRHVMTGSLVFSSQVNKLYRDPQYLVVEDVLPERQPASL